MIPKNLLAYDGKDGHHPFDQAQNRLRGGVHPKPHAKTLNKLLTSLPQSSLPAPRVRLVEWP